MIEPIADILDIPIHRVYANNLLFDASNGKFAGFDPKELTSRDGGKPAVVKKLIDAHGYGPVGKSYLLLHLYHGTDLYIRIKSRYASAKCRSSIDLSVIVTFIFHIIFLQQS